MKILFSDNVKWLLKFHVALLWHLEIAKFQKNMYKKIQKNELFLFRPFEKWV